MGVYILFVIIILSGYFLKSKKGYCILVAITMIILMGLRKYTMEVDIAQNYYYYFKQICELSFKEVISIFSKDTSFYLLTKVISLVSTNINVYLLLIGAPAIVGVAILIYKYSEDAVISWAVFLTLFFFMMFQGLRQAISFAFIFWAYAYIKEKMPFKFIVVVLIAGLFHMSALVFLIAYPLSKIKVKRKMFYWICIGVGVILFVLNVNSSMTFLIKIASAFGGTSYKVYGDLNYKGTVFSTLIYFPFCVVAIIMYNKNSDAEYNALLNLDVLGTVISFGSTSYLILQRIALFFLIFNILLFPKVVNKFYHERDRKITKFFAIVIFIAYFFVFHIENEKMYPFVFFWQ